MTAEGKHLTKGLRADAQKRQPTLLYAELGINFFFFVPSFFLLLPKRIKKTDLNLPNSTIK
jgi:hypothetical protein